VTLVGIIGAGQLGRMLALAAAPMGIRCRLLDPAPQPPAVGVAEVVTAAFDDTDGLQRLAAGAKVVTFELEHVPIEAARYVSGRVRVAPSLEALSAAQDRLLEKEAFTRLGIPCAAYAAVDDAAALRGAAVKLGLPIRLKTRFAGYDGRGQRELRTPAQVEDAASIADAGGLIAERVVGFTREVSMIAVRGGDETMFYPLVDNTHRDGILRVSRAPAEIDPALVDAARDYATRLLDAFAYRGVLALELFETTSGLLANEFAPRVHNSGHWTIEGAVTSQFANHIRAVCGLPLGRTDPYAACAMVNLIGREPDPQSLLRLPGAHLHRYGKAPRPARKLGHVTLCPLDPHALRQAVSMADAAADDP
jgi:5-(carboxyamino)imidazole ribonucleotide synthase